MKGLALLWFYTTCCIFRKERIRTFYLKERESYEKIAHQKLCNSDDYEIFPFFVQDGMYLAAKSGTCVFLSQRRLTCYLPQKLSHNVLQKTEFTKIESSESRYHISLFCYHALPLQSHMIIPWVLFQFIANWICPFSFYVKNKNH